MKQMDGGAGREEQGTGAGMGRMSLGTILALK